MAATTRTTSEHTLPGGRTPLLAIALAAHQRTPIEGLPGGDKVAPPIAHAPAFEEGADPAWHAKALENARTPGRMSHLHAVAAKAAEVTPPMCWDPARSTATRVCTVLREQATVLRIRFGRQEETFLRRELGRTACDDAAVHAAVDAVLAKWYAYVEQHLPVA